MCSGTASPDHREIRAGRPLAEGITAQPPSSWQRDTELWGGDVELHDLEQLSVKRESAAADSSLGPRAKRQKVHLEQFVKDWFVDFANLQRSKRSWTWRRSFQEAQRLSPNVFGSVHPDAALEALTGSGRETNVLAPDHTLCCSHGLALCDGC